MGDFTLTKPTFVIIGAPKCGTSSLWHYLKDHPSVAMTVPKEPRVFIEAPERPGERYGELFAGQASARHRGEATTHYADDPVYPDIARRIHEFVPDARLIYLVGEPVRRVESYHVQQVAKGAGGTQLPIDEAVRQNWEKFVSASLYAHQMERYLEHFPREQIRILFKEELQHDREAVIRKVFAHLGEPDADLSMLTLDVEHNRSADHLRMGGLGRGISGLLGALGARDIVPRGLKDRVRPYLSRRAGRQQLSPELRARIVEAVRPDTLRFRELVREDERSFVDGWMERW